MSAFGKDIRRSIRGSIGRFIAIAAIAALGVGFYAGLRMTQPDMMLSADTYYDDTDLMDIRIVSTLGMSEEDVRELGSVEGVDEVMPSRETDILAGVGDEQYAIRVHSIDSQDGDASKQPLNKLVLAEGRWPQAANECVMLADEVLPEPVHLGDKVKAMDCIADLDQTLSQTELTVVGFVHSSYYTCSGNLGSTSIGGSTIDQVVYVMPGAFHEDLPCTQAFLSVEGASEEMWGSSEYEGKVDAVLQKIESSRPQWEAARTERIRGEAQDKVDDAQEQLDDKKAEVQSALDNASAQLDSAAAAISSNEAKLESARAELAGGQAQLDAARADAEARFAQAESDLDALQQSASELEAAQGQLAAAWAAAGMGYEQALALPAAADAVRAQMEALDPASPQYAQLAAQLEQLDAAIAATRPLIAQQESFDAAKAQLDAAIAQVGSIEGAREQIAQGRAAAESEFAAQQEKLSAAQAQIDSGQAQLESGRAEYASGLSEYQASKADADRQIAQAQSEIDKAQSDVDGIDDASWYVLDRSKNYGCESYKSDAQRIGNIAAVFPLIFFLVAALVSLTTMTRMIEEERVLIGTYKALGYSRAKIASKYLLYAALATVLGSVVGIAVLGLVLPYVVQVAYSIIYYVPAFLTPISIPIALSAGGLGFAVILGATIAAAAATLHEKPAELMLPRAPKAGKRILLERIPVIWKRVSFSWKVTIRNLFRYKKRLFMTVIGIAGCTALLLTGLGLNNSINDIIDRQYGPIIKYDTVVAFDDDAAKEDKDRLGEMLAEGEFRHPSEWVRSEDMLVQPQGAPQVLCTVMVPQDPQGFGEFIDLHTRRDAQHIDLSDEGAVVTEKLAKLMDVQVGDSIVLNEQDASGTMTSVTRELPVVAIAENYTGHFVYVTPGLYRQVWGEAPVFDRVLVEGADESGHHDSFSEAARSIDGVSTVSFSKEVVETYREMLKSVNMIVVVLVLAAMALAFIVLYNLTNINIMERQREIASLKVLGFMPREVNAYIFREIMILSVIGALAGLVLGVFLEGFVVTTAEVELVMFGRAIHAASFFFSFVLTLVFTVIVMLVMRGKLSKVDMVESLKSVE